MTIKWCLHVQTEILTKEIYEFTLTPRSLFTPDSEVLPCNDKATLIHGLEAMEKEQTNDTTRLTEDCCQKIAVVDGMVVVQKLSAKVSSVDTVRDLGLFFNDRILNIKRDYDEVTIVLDTYRRESLKNKNLERHTQLISFTLLN